jgi:hypothetical protein
VNNRFQNLPFKCNLQRYNEEFTPEDLRAVVARFKEMHAVGLCTLIQVDP